MNKNDKNKNDNKNGTISVILSTYDDPTNFVDQCINSLLPQKEIYEIIVVDSSKKDDIKKFCQSINSDTSANNDIDIRYIYTPPRGLSDARNKGIDSSRKDIVAFTDVDSIVDKNWAKNVYNSITGDIAVVGGKVLPKWISTPNKILYKSAIAQGFYSSFDMGEEQKEVDQIFGGNFAINKRLTNQLFSTKFGRKSKNLLGGEELEFCRRVKANNLKVIYNPEMIVLHQIPIERTKFRWMWKRMYYGGIMRATLGGKPTPKTVNFTSYNFYDIIFLSIFMIPYSYGLLRAKFFGNT